MVSRRDRQAEAVLIANGIRHAIGAEIRDGRLAAGVSQSLAGGSVGMSHAQFSRIERADIRALTVEQLCRACAAVGLKLVVRAYPGGEPIRDAAQVALLERFHRIVPAAIPWQREVPLPAAGDQRAWDAVLTFRDGPVAVEAETRLHDVQALERRIALKQRDGGIDRVVLLVNRTATNRRVVAACREDLRPGFPLDGRDLLASLRAGRRPSSSALVLL
jgi:transcriptional regulator with XRE-family HTH domain